MVKYIKEIIILVFIISLIVFIYMATVYPFGAEVPAELKSTPITSEWARKFLTIIGIPESWLWFPALIYLFFVPFFGICAIMIGFLNALNLFSPRINFVISLVVSFSLVPLGYFTRIVSAMFAFLGMYSVAAFGILFFFGVISVVLSRLYEWGFTPSATYSGLIDEIDYNKLRDWFLDTYAKNKYNVSNAKINKCLNEIMKILNNAEKEWKEGKRKNAIRFLKQKAQEIEKKIKNAGGSVNPAPK